MTTTHFGITDEGTERATVGSLVRQADNALGHVWEALLTGRLGLEDVRAVSPNLFALLVAAEQMGEASQAARVRQAEHDADRMWLAAFGKSVGEIERRLDASLEAIPDHVEIHSAEYFTRAFSGIYADGQEAA